MKREAVNTVKTVFDAISVNEAFARGVLGAFLLQADPTVPQLADMKTALSEAVTNCIVHAYPEEKGKVKMELTLYRDGWVRMTVADKGIGMEDVKRAMEPLFTTGNPDERAGLGFAVMQSFMDKVKVSSKPGRGTRVVMEKKLER